MAETRKSPDATAEFLTTRKGKALTTAGTTALIMLGLRGTRGLGRRFAPEQLKALGKQFSKGQFHFTPKKAFGSKSLKDFVTRGKRPFTPPPNMDPKLVERLKNIDPLGGTSIASSVIVMGGIGALLQGLDRDNYAYTLANKVSVGKKLTKTEKAIVGSAKGEVKMPKSWRSIGSKSGAFHSPAAVSAMATAINLGGGLGVGAAAKSAGDALIERSFAKNLNPRALASRAHSKKGLRVSEKSLLSALRKAKEAA